MSDFTCDDCAAFGKLKCICAEIEAAKNPETRFFINVKGISEYDGYPYISQEDVTDYVNELKRKADAYDALGGDSSSEWW